MEQLKLKTYEEVLNFLQASEIKKQNTYRQLFVAACFCFVISTIILLYFGIFNVEDGILEISDILEVALIPLFNFIFASIQKDLMECSKLYIINILKEKFQSAEISNDQIKETEIQSFIIEILKSKI